MTLLSTIAVSRARIVGTRRRRNDLSGTVGATLSERNDKATGDMVDVRNSVDEDPRRGPILERAPQLSPAVSQAETREFSTKN